MGHLGEQETSCSGAPLSRWANSVNQETPSFKPTMLCLRVDLSLGEELGCWGLGAVTRVMKFLERTSGYLLGIGKSMVQHSILRFYLWMIPSPPLASDFFRAFLFFDVPLSSLKLSPNLWHQLSKNMFVLSGWTLDFFGDWILNVHFFDISMVSRRKREDLEDRWVGR